MWTGRWDGAWTWLQRRPQEETGQRGPRTVHPAHLQLGLPAPLTATCPPIHFPFLFQVSSSLLLNTTFLPRGTKKKGGKTPGRCKAQVSRIPEGQLHQDGTGWFYLLM